MAVVGEHPIDLGMMKQRDGSPGRLTPQHSLAFDRWAAHLPVARGWVVAAIGVALILVPLALGYLEHVPRLFSDYRAQFVYAALLVYILSVNPWVLDTRESVAQSLRPLMQLDREQFQELVARACVINPRHEILWFAVGMVVGWLINLFFEPLEENAHLLEVYAYLSRIGLFGMIVWTIYVLFATTRLANALLRQPLAVNILDIRPFEPIGRQSLWLALALIGGLLLSLLSVSYQNRFLWLEYAITYSIVIALAVLVFFLNMRSAHRVLAAAKRLHLETADRSLADVYSRFQAMAAEGRDTFALATQINAIATMRHELRMTRTWPYNTEMLRTLLISAATPLFAALARIAETFLRN